MKAHPSWDINYMLHKQVKLSYRHNELINCPAAFWSLVTVFQNFHTANPELKVVLKISLSNKPFQRLFVKIYIEMVKVKTKGRKTKTENLAEK